MAAEVVVYGGTPAGVVAAVAAATRGSRVTLVNPGRHLGGMASGGLSTSDVADPAIIGGLAREFFRRVGRHYGAEARFDFEPHVAEAVFDGFVREAGVELRSGRPLQRVEKAGARITALVLDDAAVPGCQFVDASYEGDLLALAGVRYRVGRESDREYDEPLAGVRAESHGHQFEVAVDPYVRPGDPGSGLLPRVEAPDGAVPGSADRRVEAYNFRLCLTRVAGNRLPLPPPESYHAAQYELLARLLAARRRAGRAVRFADLFLIVELPNGKADFNSRGPVSTDLIGASSEYPDGDPAARARIWQDHVDYTRGLFHFLATDPRLPEELQAEARAWGLCRDEFVDGGGWPHQLYIREARRMLGRYVMTQADCERRIVVDDAVALAAYPIDSHHCRRLVVDGRVQNEGDIEVAVPAYPVSYRALTPRAEDCENLLVPVCLSASHVAYGSLRTEAVYMALGQAAGLVASDAAAGGRSVQAVDVARLQRELEAAGAILRRPPLSVLRSTVRRLRGLRTTLLHGR